MPGTAPATSDLLGVLAGHVDRGRGGGDDEVEHPRRAVDAEHHGRVGGAGHDDVRHGVPLHVRPSRASSAFLAGE